MQLSKPLNCLIIQHVINDPDTIEHYLTIDPLTTEKCLPIALRDVLNEYAIPAGLPPMTIPDVIMLLRYLFNIWSPYYTVNMKLDDAVCGNLIYLVPYLLTHGADIELLSPYSVGQAIEHGNLDIIKLLFLPPKVSGRYMWEPEQISTEIIRKLWSISPKYSLPALEIMLESHPDTELIRGALTQASLSAFHGTGLMPEYMPIVHNRIIQYITTGK
jgi:hypothetical protein